MTPCGKAVVNTGCCRGVAYEMHENPADVMRKKKGRMIAKPFVLQTINKP